MNVIDPLVSTIINYVDKNPEKNLDTLANIMSKIAIMPRHKQQIESVRRFLNDKESNWYKFTVKGLKNIDKNILKTLVVNFLVNASLKGIPKQQEWEEKLGVSVPWAILMDPTEACNLRCAGCWAGQYKPHNLSFEVMDRVCTEAEELGIYFIVLSGGEPTVRMKDIIKLAERHKNQVFHLFTNGTLIDEDMIREVKRVGNITFAVSINGLRETNDAIRGEGTFDKIMRTMDLMRENGVLFGYSATYTRTNVEEISSDEFVDMMIDKGAYFAWYFTYIPVGRDPDIQFMVTPEQRKYMYERINYIRATKELFAIDFWNDGEFSSGCIAGGRRYLHINAAGEVEPCAFIHYSNVNINEVSLKEALQSPIMKAYRKRQPFNQNHLRPCPLIDNPEKLLEIVEESGAKHTEASEASHIKNLYDDLTVVADNWGKVADEIWEKKMEMKKEA
ncbi:MULTISPECIES: radical SAM protein [Thermoanaerobacter]|uniref:Radical SAM domain protein n=2 Tax=Thermoanaerobacter TaxID=1754 RepID=D3T3L8_THEIA|nr:MULTISPECIES: radical SAM protein [Thermoanaerobacter]ADD02820.1 Radical SAM domain protein [Thermoanaerobacter italicus Ab9]MDP9750904.1 MoaA/NifB/PqqE/SkfB family radical SAM enzyme [Thermoanaerobacter pentosaceus]